jgi:bifunctional DNase/RNase
LVRTVIYSIRRSPVSNEHVLILREQQGKRYLVTSVTPTEANEIVAALHNDAYCHISIYDLLRLVIEGLSARVSMAIIHNINRSTEVSFQAKLVLNTGDKQRDIICPAPVAIAVATFTQAPIFVQESVMDAASVGSFDKEVFDLLEAMYDPDSARANTEKPPKPIVVNRILSSEETGLTGTEVKLEVSRVSSLILHYQNIVILSDQQRNWNLALWTGYDAANTIRELIQNTAAPEPYQLLCRILETFSSRVNMTVIHEFRESEDTIRAKLICESGDRRFSVECRPSDAIVVALTAKAPIYASESVLAELRSSTDVAMALIGESDKHASNQKEVESLISLVKPSPWKFRVSTKKQEEAVKRLLEISIRDPDPNIRQAAVKALQTFHANH